MLEGVHRRLEQRPAQVAGAVFAQWPGAVGVSRLVDAWAEAGIAGQLLGRGEALDLADLGGDREGLIASRSGPLDASGTEWWGRWPDANIGVVIGQNETVVDIDTEGAHDEFRERVGEPETTVIRTPRGGWHYLFAGSLANRVLVTDGAHRLLEVKGARTNRVAPGSVSSDGTWTLTVDVPAAPLPNALIEWAKEAARTVANRTAAIPVGRHCIIPELRRNVTLTQMAGHLWRVGLARETLEGALLDHNRRWCRPPLKEAEVRRIAASASRFPDPPPWALAPHRWAFEVCTAYGLGPAERLVLYSLCSGANDEGKVTRGVRRLETETSLSRPTVIKALRSLETVEIVRRLDIDSRFGTSFEVARIQLD
jgi:hypothetical protein